MSNPLPPKREGIFCASMGLISMCVCIVVMSVHARFVPRGKRGQFEHISGDRPLFGSGDGNINFRGRPFCEGLVHTVVIFLIQGTAPILVQGIGSQKNAKIQGTLRGLRGSPDFSRFFWFQGIPFDLLLKTGDVSRLSDCGNGRI